MCYSMCLKTANQPMRFLLLTMFLLLAIGCNSDPRCRRETALLRAEILDLEDKYYLLKSENDSLMAGQGISGETISYPDSIQSQPYYTDTGEPYYPMAGSGEIIYDDEVFYENQLPTHQYIGGGQYIEGEQYIVDNGREIQRLPNSSILSPDNSIAPLEFESDNNAHSVVQNNDNLEDDRTLYDPSSEFSLDQPGLTELDRSTDMDILLDAPKEAASNFGIGFNQYNTAKEVTEVVVNRSVSVGRDVDGYVGDEGLDLLVQTRTADGQNELVAGQLTVSVIDPLQSREHQRIGLWKFLPEETELFFANSEIGSYGILLHLPWDQQTPVNKKLIVHVRFLTPDGRELTSSSEIWITPPDANYSPDAPEVTGWTRRDSRWIAGSSRARLTPSVPQRRSRSRSNSPDTDWQRASVSGRPPTRLNPSSQNRVPAIPAKAEIQKPTWRPTR